MLPKQEQSVKLAREMRRAAREDDIHFILTPDSAEQVILDLLSLVEQYRPQDPHPARPGTLRHLIYAFKEQVLAFPETLEEEVVVESSLGTRPITHLESSDVGTSLMVDGEFWDPDIHPGLLVDLEAPEVYEALLETLEFPARVVQVLETLSAFHQQSLEAETGR